MNSLLFFNVKKVQEIYEFSQLNLSTYDYYLQINSTEYWPHLCIDNHVDYYEY